MPALTEEILTNEMPQVERAVRFGYARKYPLSALAKEAGKPDNSHFFWNAYYLPDEGVEGVVDGTKTAPDKSEQTVQVASFTQEIREPWAVSRRGAAVKTHDAHNTPAWQMKRALEKLYRKKEIVIGSRQDLQAQAKASSTPQLTRGLLNIMLPKNVAGQTLQPVPDAARLRNDSYWGGALADLTPDAFRSMLKAAASYFGGEVELTGFCGPDLKAQMAAWVYRDATASGTKAYRTVQGDAQMSLNLDVDVFKFGEGVVTTVLDFWLACNVATGAKTELSASAGVFIDPRELFTYTLQGLNHTAIADEGQGKSGFYALDFGVGYGMPSKGLLVLPGVAASKD